ncbi:hypothetical protein MUP59_04735 [Candidatus Bathyarchaeota archaeon]|nr:hypothetical protein [Candidatus Bathyarchaeota archaeon]
MTEAFSRKTLLDSASIFFLLGSIVVLVISVLRLPVAQVLPSFRVGTLSYPDLVAIIAGIIGAVLGFDCFYMTTKRKLSDAGIRGIVIGAVLLSIAWVIGLQMIGLGAVLVLVAGVICYIYRD